MERKMREILQKNAIEWSAFERGEDLDSRGPLMSELYEYFVNSGEMPLGIAKARTGDPHQWIYDQLEKKL